MKQPQVAKPATLTQATVFTLPLPTKGDRVFYRDSKMTGLALCVLASGARRWYLDKWHGGKLTRLKLDDATVLTLAQARERAQKLLGQMSDGVDLVAERRAARVRGMTLQQALDGYLADRVNLKPRTHADYQTLIDRHAADWKARELASLDGEALKARHRRIGQTDKAGANYFVRVIRALWNWAAVGDPKTYALNPAKTISATKSWYKIERRRTRLQAHEIGAWWRATGELDAQGTAFLRLLLLLGLRIGEAASIHGEHIDLKAKTMRIAGKTGTRTAHLGSYSAAIIESLSPKPGVLFDNCEPRYVTAMRKRLRQANEQAALTIAPHDLRRTYASILEALGAPYVVTKSLMGHALPANDVTHGYIVPDEPLLRHWQQRLEDAVMAASASPARKVVPFAKTKRAKRG